SDLLGEWPGEDHGDGAQRDEQEKHERNPKLKRAKLPERPALLDLIDDVRRPREGADVPRGGPKRPREAQNERDSGRALARRDLLDGPGDDALGRTWAEGVDVVEH